MDNATVHKTPEGLQAIRDRGSALLLLLPYSPFLNPIEKCWAKANQEVRKISLMTNEILADCKEVAAKTVTAESCRG
ncbi:hypothetical protein BCV72DRAFT_318862 [Rhizopus microsporus var. microsporus]|uniref:Tc1-like transposase DDE domain-containing protein n=1 Tax=Rhizopus microsporus var. microsporus TaxID=86635 RepID=A0A1X0RCA0_RHIZD|nr:hypothetical protein BCV72DRAFT_318862 [Rhizopus microsporus var. microsporus]